MGLRDVLEKFARSTTMHGMPKIISSHSIFARIFWSLICVAAGAMFCTQISELLQKYFSFPKKVTVEIATGPQPFPSISVCNMRHLDVYTLNTLNRKFIEDDLPMNHINKTNDSFINEYMALTARFSELWYRYQMTHTYVFQEAFSQATYVANIPEEIISTAGVQIDQFIVKCNFGQHECNITQDFKQFFDPKYFNCFTYMSPETKEIAVLEGIENGLSSILFSGGGVLDKNEEIRVLPGVQDSQSLVSASEGIQVVIHPSGTPPLPYAEGYAVPPGYSASFGLRPRWMKRIGTPYGNCTDRYTLGDTSDGYRLISCQNMCLQRYIVSLCNCKDKTLPDLPELNATSCRSTRHIPDSCMLNATSYCLDLLLRLYANTQCIRSAKVSFTKKHSSTHDCACFPACNEVAYDISYSLAKWPASGYEGDAVYLDLFHVESFPARYSGTPKYDMMSNYFNNFSHDREKMMRDFARINVYIADTNAYIVEEAADYSSAQLLSDIGGQLGLWVGISVITLAELLELLCDLCGFVCDNRQHTSNVGKQQERETSHIGTSNTLSDFWTKIWRLHLLYFIGPSIEK